MDRLCSTDTVRRLLRDKYGWRVPALLCSNRVRRAVSRRPAHGSVTVAVALSEATARPTFDGVELGYGRAD